MKPSLEEWEVLLAEPARWDIDEIYDWSVARFGQARAERYIGVLRAEIAALRRGPGVVNSTPCPEIQTGLRRLRAGSHSRHVIYHRVIAARAILVVRILHDRMDPARHLKD